MQKHLLITGAHGFLASRIAAHWGQTCRITALTRQDADLTNPAQVLRAVQSAAPDVVIHCAAISDTGYAEAHPEESYAVNVQGSIHMAQACLAAGAQMLYMSSDQVYNGCTLLQPLPETAPLAPENVYGRHKLEAERAVQEILPDAVGLRLTWLYDMPVQGCKTSSNLLCNLLRAGLQTQTLKFPVRQLRGVTWAQQLVRQMPALLALPGGVYNAGSTGAPDETAYETAVYAAKALGAANAEALVQPDLARYAAHVCNLSMDTHKLAGYGVHFSSNVQGIDACLRAYGWAGVPAEEA